MLGLLSILNFKFSRDAHVWDFIGESWSRFVFELVWTLVSWTQPSGPLCLWQCFSCQWECIEIGIHHLRTNLPNLHSYNSIYDSVFISTWWLYYWIGRLYSLPSSPINYYLRVLWGGCIAYTYYWCTCWRTKRREDSSNDRNFLFI